MDAVLTRSMRLASAVCVSMLLAWPARAQSGAYVGGSLFADIQRSSGITGSTSPAGSTGSTKLDGTAIGWGIRGGAFLASSWTLEVSFDRGATIDRTVSQQPTPLPLASTASISSQIAALLSPIIIRPQFTEHLSARTTATSVLLAYHPPAAKRLRAGFAGGLTFMHTATTLVGTLQYVVNGTTVPPPRTTVIPVPIAAPFTTETDSALNQLAATVGAEVAVSLSQHASVVPEIRVHGLEARFVIRPGVGVRWQW
jgi:hypothetical protein